MEQNKPEDQFQEIVDFLSKTKESRDQALDIILSFTTTMVNRRNFISTDVDKQLLRLTEQYINDESVTSKAFQCLINFSLDKTWVERLITLNVARRVFEFLMHNVKPTSGSIRTTNAQIIKVKHTEEGGDFDVYEIRAGQANSIQAAVMVLSNVAITESGQRHLLGSSDSKTKGAVLENLVGMFTYFRTSEMFDFVANILANVSSLKEGRCWMIEQTQNILNPTILLLQNRETNAHRIKHLIAVIRNVLFEYEKYEKDFIQMDIIQLICRILVKEHGLTEHSLPQSWMHLKDVAEKEVFANMVDIDNTRELLDGLMLLANSQTFLKIMDSIKIYELFEALKIKPFGETRTKIDVINAQIMALSMPPTEVEAEDLD